ncbi:lysophospholipid acyltransferase family protein [Muricoccus radiodurans]|uniref:lysophospholipid acyltransferase family protein n=1 Tax=Muricoccus radiodurans TaxID=2231721 RepID=UPI003CE856C6
MLKRLLRHPATLALAARLIGLYLALTYATTRWTVLGAAALAPVAEPGLPLIGAFWHERLPMMPMLWRVARHIYPKLGRHRAHVLVSRHRDGRFIGDIVRRFDLDMVYGSTSRGGATGVATLLRLLEAGEVAAITPDGPRGPRRQAAPGVAQIAAASGVPVVPCAAAMSRRAVLPSWDRMLLPLPFGRGVIVVMPPVAVPPHGAEAALPGIARAMTEACEIADAWIAGRPVPPMDSRPG